MELGAMFKLVNPYRGWHRVSLQGLRLVCDIREAIRMKVIPNSDPYSFVRYPIKVTRKDRDANNAVELNEEDDLVSVLRQFNIENPPSVEQSFADNIWLFVDIPSNGLLSETGFLQHVPPSLDYVIKTSKPGITRSNSYPTPGTPIRWDDFLDNVNNTPWDSVPKYPPPSFDQILEVEKESMVQYAVYRNVLRPLDMLREGKGRFGSALLGMVGEPDFVFKVSDIVRLVVEVKTKWAISTSVEDLVETYKQEVKDRQDDKRPSKSVFHQLRQIFGYLAGNCIQFGVLTTYDKTWFLSRCSEDPTVLRISPAIRIDNQQPTLFQCFHYFIRQTRNAHQFQPLPSSVPSAPSDNNNQPPRDDGDDDGNDKDQEHRQKRTAGKQKPVRRNPPRGAGEKTSTTGRNTATTRPGRPSGGEAGHVAVENFNWGSFRTNNVLGSGRSGTVFEATMRGETIALKICDLNKHPDYEKELLNEIAVYNALKSLQGVCIPRLKAAGHDPGGLFLTATEIAGRPLENGEKLSDEERQVIRKALSSIHDHGFVHGDIHEDNILINRSDREFHAFFIDFAYSERGNKGDFQNEMQSLTCLLGQS